MPTGLQYPDARVSADGFAVGADRHGTDGLPLPDVMVERVQVVFLTGLQWHTEAGVGQVREADGHRLIEVAGAVGLDGDHDRELQPARQCAGQSIGRHGRDAHSTAARSVVGKQ